MYELAPATPDHVTVALSSPGVAVWAPLICFVLLFILVFAVLQTGAMQLIKGGFSFRAKRELGMHHSIWQRGYFDYRIRDEEDFRKRREYIHQNPVRAGLVQRPEDFPFSSAEPSCCMDKLPQRLKPSSLANA